MGRAAKGRGTVHASLITIFAITTAYPLSRGTSSSPGHGHFTKGFFRKGKGQGCSMSENLLPYLHQAFPGAEVITTAEFRDFLKISPSTGRRMRLAGQYPRTISLHGSSGEKRILLFDLAAWLERGGMPS